MKTTKTDHIRRGKGFNMNKKKGLAVILAFALAFTMSMSSVAFAAEGDGYLALGSDLSESERNTVMDLLGVDDPENYNVIYVTNAEEHKYLDSYVDTDQIGSRALSSVLIKEQGGSDIDVEIHNIGYCTEGMYRNALQTAGVEGAEVVVAGPFEISGTAALVGTIKAYEEMSGEDVDDEVIEGAVDELTTTGEVGEELGDKEAAEDIVSQVKEDLADDPDMSDDQIVESIKQAASEAGYDLSEASIEKIKSMVKNLQGLNIDWSGLKEKLNQISESSWYQRLLNWFMKFFE
ncbi:MAG: DUF1002 domain-containing protein [Firmicutes bacterium]|nr:DUF1002 domain-containing protein [Bacillota bacterium]